MIAIVAADRNWGIGRNNGLLVSIPADMRFFRKETLGKVVVMGRKTLDSFPGGLPLKGRTNLVLTRQKDLGVKDALLLHNLEELKEELDHYPPEDVYCIGGAAVYRELLPLCSQALVTRIDYVYEADAFFPDLDRDPEWEKVWEGEEETYFDLEYRFTRYVRHEGKE